MLHPAKPRDRLECASSRICTNPSLHLVPAPLTASPAPKHPKLMILPPQGSFGKNFVAVACWGFFLGLVLFCQGPPEFIRGSKVLP